MFLNYLRLLTYLCADAYQLQIIKKNIKIIVANKRNECDTTLGRYLYHTVLCVELKIYLCSGKSTLC